MITPTIGRRVWYWPSEADCGKPHKDPLFYTDKSQACDAGVAYVWNDRMVNLTVADQNGKMHTRTSVRLLQDDDVAGEGEAHAQWMPYQVQAAKPAEPRADAVPVGSAGFIDPNLGSAGLFVIAQQEATHESLMRRFDISHLHADELLVSLEKVGVVGPEAGGVRPVLVKP